MSFPYTLLALILSATAVVAGEPLHLKALRRAPIRQLRDDERSVIGYLTRGESVTVIDVSEAGYLVDAQTVMGVVRGWIDANTVEAPPAGFLETTHKQRDQAAAHREVIDRHEVVVGMTREEVRASLGKPERRSRVRSQEDELELWFYATYRYLPSYTRSYDENGQLRQVVSYERVIAGNKVVTFRGNEVTAVEDRSGTQTRPAPTVWK